MHVRDCTPSWVKELPGGVADDVIFPIRVVGPSEMGLLRCKYRTSSWRLSWRRCCCPSGRELSPSIHVHLVLTNLTAVLSGRVDENLQEAFQQVRVRGGFCLPVAVACLGQGPEADDLDVHRQILGHPSSSFFPELFQAAPTAPLARVKPS